MKDFRRIVGQGPTTIVSRLRHKAKPKWVTYRQDFNAPTESWKIRFNMEKYEWRTSWFIVWHVILPATYYQMIPDCPPLSPKITPLRNWM